MNHRKVGISNRYGPKHIGIDVQGEVYGASGLEIFELNVLRREGNRFTCEVQFEAILDIEFVLSFESGLAAYDAGYEPGKTYFESESRDFTFVAGVLVNFDYANSGPIEIASLDFDPEIEIELRDLDFYRHFR